LQYLTENQKNNRTLVDIAINNKTNAYRYISDELKTDKSLLLAVIKEGLQKEYIPKQYLSDRDIIYELDFYFLNEVPGRISKYKDYANDEEMILNLISMPNKKPTVFRYISKILLNNKTFLKKAASINGCILEYLYEDQQSDIDIDIVQIAILNDVNAYRFVSEKLKNNKILLIFVINEGLDMHYIPNTIKDDEEVILNVISKRPEIFKYRSERLLCNIDFLKRAESINRDILKYCNENIINKFFVVGGKTIVS